MPIVIWHKMKTHVNQTKYHVTADTQPEPRRLVPCSQRYPEVAHYVLNTWSGCIMWPHFFSPSLTCVWSSHWVSSLCPLTQRLPNICSLSQTRLIQLRRHWMASQKVSLSGGWLSGRMWADSCPGDWRNQRWSRLADHWYLPCCSGRIGGGAHLANWWYETNAVHLKPLGCAPYIKLTDDTCKIFNIHRPPHWKMKGTNVLLWEESMVTHFQFKYRRYIQSLALNKPKWASAKWLIPEGG